MERQNVEEGLLAKHESNITTSCDCGDTASPLPWSKSSTTAVVIFSTLVAVCGSFTYGFAIGYSSPTESGIMEDLGLSIAAYSVFGSIMTFGGMLGAILSGKIADIFGRRKAMWLSEIFCTIGWLNIAFAKGALWLDLGRLFLGFGVGIITYVVPVYVAEITPKDLRGVFTAFHQLMNTFGFSLIYFIGNVIPWRILALIGVIPCVLQLIGLFFIPESPRWLDHIEISQQHSEARFLDLFRRKYANSLIIGIGLMILQQFGGTSALGYYASSIFEEAGVSSSIGSKGMAILQIPAVITGVFLIDKAGRRPLHMISASGMCFGSLLLGLSFCLKVPMLALVGFLGNAVSSTLGNEGIPYVIMSEIFPINVKASAGSLVILISWSCSWIVTYTFNFMMQWSSAGTFFFFACISFSTVLFVAKMVPETKGQTLEEIQDSISISFLR